MIPKDLPLELTFLGLFGHLTVTLPVGYQIPWSAMNWKSLHRALESATECRVIDLRENWVSKIISPSESSPAQYQLYLELQYPGGEYDISSLFGRVRNVVLQFAVQKEGEL